MCTLQAQFDAAVEHGFQASSTLQQGKLVASESGASGPPMSTVPSASWALNITPKVGWGAAGAGGVGGQKATAGWLSALAVFEPHWQVRGGGNEGARVEMGERRRGRGPEYGKRRRGQG